MISLLKFFFFSFDTSLLCTFRFSFLLLIFHTIVPGLWYRNDRSSTNHGLLSFCSPSTKVRAIPNTHECNHNVSNMTAIRGYVL